ncbi:MAG: undecaprenyl-diphosphate phosphatase [Firmicutes bacterium]|nr:undecaprenyl-diphosphate phosphatase [Bacillota bacterium]
MNTYIIAVILGIVEGLTEFIPVSSTGHLIIAGNLLGFSGVKAATFEVFIQLGAIAAVVLVYRSRFIGLLTRWKDTRFLNLIHIIAAMAPALLLGYLLHDIVKHNLFSVQTVLIGLVMGSVLLFVAASRAGGLRKTDSLDDITVFQAFIIGVFQCLSLWPGFSRSGSTIAGGILSGLSFSAAAEFSFIVAVPIMFAATGYDLIKSYHYLSLNDIPLFAIGFTVSFLVAWLAIVWFLRVLNKLGLSPFAWYRIAIAAIFWLVVLS